MSGTVKRTIVCPRSIAYEVYDARLIPDSFIKNSYPATVIFEISRRLIFAYSKPPPLTLLVKNGKRCNAWCTVRGSTRPFSVFVNNRFHLPTFRHSNRLRDRARPDKVARNRSVTNFYVSSTVYIRG